MPGRDEDTGVGKTGAVLMVELLVARLRKKRGRDVLEL
jgi:hypothetical protein